LRWLHPDRGTRFPLRQPAVRSWCP
jgi:hypothetical protein